MIFQPGITLKQKCSEEFRNLYIGETKQPLNKSIHQDAFPGDCTCPHVTPTVVHTGPQVTLTTLLTDATTTRSTNEPSGNNSLVNDPTKAKYLGFLTSQPELKKSLTER